MKKITLLISSALTVFGLNAQITDTVSLGAEYVNDVYYSLENNEVKTVERDWDIAFQVSGMSSTIRINGASGTELYNYPNGDISHWSSIDTSGISSWTKYYNSDSSWSKGAFSQTSSGMFDLGWGIYNMSTHYVTGDSLFIIKLSNLEYKKLWIDRLASGVYYFKYSDLDGSNEVLDTLKKDDYINKNFGYYSIQNEVEIDREPDNTSWDLVFTKYGKAITPSYYMGVTGVLGNDGVSVNEVSGIHNEDADTLNTSFSNSISVIGYDWKTYDYLTRQYSANDSLTYFIKAKDSQLWKLVFTGFGGSSSGNFYFTKEKITSSVGTQELNISSVGTFPNPASNLLNIVFDQKNADESKIDIYNISGVKIYSNTIQGHRGINTLKLNVDNYASGLYMINISSQGGSILSKIMVK
ncbi:MAG: hypothetical protein CMP61_07950 [Flavobacteriales bacterium]|nr:hypothetical protein [Flavobacteriales bacterium]|tara:strand:+ start:2594 stop:3826 length:1233 start_codon:yes stop_codon:yes gene_type:complete